MLHGHKPIQAAPAVYLEHLLHCVVYCCLLDLKLVSLNLADIQSQGHSTVVTVDASIRRPSVTNPFYVGSLDKVVDLAWLHGAWLEPNRLRIAVLPRSLASAAGSLAKKRSRDYSLVELNDRAKLNSRGLSCGIQKKARKRSRSGASTSLCRLRTQCYCWCRSVPPIYHGCRRGDIVEEPRSTLHTLLSAYHCQINTHSRGAR